MTTYTVTIVDEHGDTYRETVQADGRVEAELAALAVFRRDLSHRAFRIVSVVVRDTRLSNSR